MDNDLTLGLLLLLSGIVMLWLAIKEVSFGARYHYLNGYIGGLIGIVGGLYEIITYAIHYFAI